jgi:hypothetical protein
MQTACPSVLLREGLVELEGLVPGAGAARVPRPADRNLLTCRTDLHSWSRVREGLLRLMMEGVVEEGLEGRIASRTEVTEEETVEEEVEKMTEPRLFSLCEILEETDPRV